MHQQSTGGYYQEEEVQSLIEQITREHALEKASNRKAVNPEDIPVSYEAITAEWLTHIVCKGVPGARVVSYRLDAPDDGQTNRRRIHIAYNDAGNAARLPPSVFCKAAHQLDTRLINGIGGLIQGEDAFYNKYRPLLDIEAPTCFFATYDRHSYNSIVVLDDLARYGVEFCQHTTDITRQRAESQMSLLARLHGRFYAGAEITQSDLPTFEEVFHNIDAWLGWEKYCTSGFAEAEAVIPSKLFRRQAEIWPATLKSVAVHAAFPRTFTHNDVHLKNWYITAGGQMVLSDWQCFGKGHWARDFAYTISTALTVENRRAWEKELLQFYLDRLQAAGGPAVAFSDAWNYYRQHLLSTLSFWTSTLALGTTHPKDETREFVARITAAIDDLDAVNSLS